MNVTGFLPPSLEGRGPGGLGLPVASFKSFLVVLKVESTTEMISATPPNPSLKLDPSADVLHYDVRGLDAIIAPKTVAIIGATEKAGSVGRTIVWNLLSSPFGGTVFPVNPKRANILGIKAYPNIGAVPDRVDLAVIVTPAPTVPDIIAECVAAGVKGAIIIRSEEHTSELQSL